VRRAKIQHRDTLQPILTILEADSPLREYSRISEEVWKHRPDRTIDPLAAAECTRTFLLLRFGMHLGVRQRNLRELLYCKRGDKPRSEAELIRLRRGELRWNIRENGWEVFIPYQAFKNPYSSFFARKPFRLIIPNVGNLYAAMDIYLNEDRGILIESLPDPKTFFVRSYKRLKIKKGAAYSAASLTDAWKVAIQKYGIHNPYTGRGAIAGLLPHGPHNIRDILATHILKRTGSYEIASYAIQSTPEVVAAHYGRFMRNDKTNQAASYLNEVWDEVAEGHNARKQRLPDPPLPLNEPRLSKWRQYRRGKPRGLY